MPEEKTTFVEGLFRQHGPILKTGFLRENGIYYRALAKLTRNGSVQKLKTGYYAWGASMLDISDVEAAAALVPFGIVCLQSAAVLHELTTLNPLAVTIAIPSNRTRVALPEYPPIELVSSAMQTFELGAVKMGGIHVYGRERTVCDFFRKRKQLGNDLALEVLQSYMRGPRNLQTLFDYAGALRIKGVIKPYVEALS